MGHLRSVLMPAARKTFDDLREEAKARWIKDALNEEPGTYSRYSEEALKAKAQERLAGISSEGMSQGKKMLEQLKKDIRDEWMRELLPDYDEEELNAEAKGAHERLARRRECKAARNDKKRRANEPSSSDEGGSPPGAAGNVMEASSSDVSHLSAAGPPPHDEPLSSAADSPALNIEPGTELQMFEALDVEGELDRTISALKGRGQKINLRPYQK